MVVVVVAVVIAVIVAVVVVVVVFLFSEINCNLHTLMTSNL